MYGFTMNLKNKVCVLWWCQTPDGHMDSSTSPVRSACMFSTLQTTVFLRETKTTCFQGAEGKSRSISIKGKSLAERFKTDYVEYKGKQIQKPGLVL